MPTTASTPRSPRREQMRAALEDQTLFSWQLVLPALVMLVLFQVVPIALGVLNSLRKFSTFETRVVWNGFRNYAHILTDPHFFGTILPNTLLFVLLAVSIELVLGMGIAILINRRIALAGAVRTLLLLPLMVAPLLSGLMFAWMFNDQFGVANVVMKALGFSPVAWLTQRWTAFSVIILADVWTWTPWFVVILFAGLQTLPRDPHEAAMLDGATPWQVFWHVTLPLLFPVLAVTLVLRSFDAFRVFDVVWAVTGGGPGRGTEVFSVYTYKEAFGFMKFGTAAAAANIGALIQMVIGFLFYRTVRRALERSKVQPPPEAAA